MEPVIIIIIGLVLIVIAFVGSILPALPGPPVAYGALLLFFANDKYQNIMADNNYVWLIVLGIITLAITALDYVLPVWGTKKWGGTKAGVRGSTIGLIIGAALMFFTAGIGAFALLLGPFIGAYIGETRAGQTPEVARKSAIGSFFGFITGTVMKLAIVAVIGSYFVSVVW